MEISFQRTIRVADGIDISELPPSMGTFPLYSVHSYKEKLPAAMVAKGGLFFAMYQREAMWINFKSNGNFAIKIYLGGINAVSGEPMVETLATQVRRSTRKAEGASLQDYVVLPGQRWLDGIATAEGTIRKFVAMPVGSGYSVEAQITGQELMDGLQFEITPEICATIPKEPSQHFIICIKTLTGKVIELLVPDTLSVFDLKLRIQDKEGIPPDVQRLIFGGNVLGNYQRLDQWSVQANAILHLVLTLRGGGPMGPAEMGIAAGGLIKQSIFPDRNPATIWDSERTICFNVQILNTEIFRSVTGLAPPNCPISAKTYQQLGLPYFKLVEEASSIKGNFEEVKSVKAMDKAKKVVEKDGSLADLEETLQPQSVVLLNPGNMTKFRSVSEMEQEAARKGWVQF